MLNPRMSLKKTARHALACNLARMNMRTAVRRTSERSACAAGRSLLVIKADYSVPVLGGGMHSFRRKNGRAECKIELGLRRRKQKLDDVIFEVDNQGGHYRSRSRRHKVL